MSELQIPSKSLGGVEEESSSDEDDRRLAQRDYAHHMDVNLVAKLKDDIASDSCYGDDYSHTDEHVDDDDLACVEEKEKSKFSGRGVTLPMLMQDGLIEAGKGVMSIDYLGHNFIADLLVDGRIKEGELIFNSPSAWAIHCKKIVNPSKKSGCGWASVKFRGKKLDAYKTDWFRNQTVMSSSSPYSTDSEITISKEPAPKSVKAEGKMELMMQDLPLNLTMPTAKHDGIKDSVSYRTLGRKTSEHDPKTLVKCTPFSALGRIQPFTISISSNCLLLMDFHSHLTTSEIVGYMAGKWDANTQHMSILQAFPCRCRLGDAENAVRVESEIRMSMESRGLTLLGWYHSHPKNQADPSLRDIDSQMDYQLKLKGAGHSYLPCIGLILAPFDPVEKKRETSIQAFWVMPPPENRMNDYGMPVLMECDASQDIYLSQDLLNEMKWLADYYQQAPDLIKFSENWHQGCTYIEKVKSSLVKKFPKDQTDGRFLDFIHNLLVSLEPAKN